MVGEQKDDGYEQGETDLDVYEDAGDEAFRGENSGSV